MGQKPICLLQMQRLGDLVLTFPFALWLRRRFPGHPLWVVAEKKFFEGLRPLSPELVYVPWEEAAGLLRQRFHLVVNLSIRKQAAQLAGALRSDETIGPVLQADGTSRIRGNWQLYRASLINNNRHNRFHWAELNALDLIPLSGLAATAWAAPHSAREHSSRVGLFLGASQEFKRPGAAFWARLVERLHERQLLPVLLGGKDEIPLGQQVRQLAKSPCLDLCGKYALPGFVSALSGLGLLLTPDTGPMHLAAWMGVLVCNLSMGPVSPWETGPYQPGQYVLQAALSCAGCWECTHPRTYYCREMFSPRHVALVAQRLLRRRPEDLPKLRLAGLRLKQSSRTADGLYALPDLRPDTADKQALRNGLGEFWRSFFGVRFGLWDETRASEAWQAVAQVSPVLSDASLKALVVLGKRLVQAIRKPDTCMDQSFWANLPPVLRPLSSYLHLDLQNQDFSTEALRRSVEVIDQLRLTIS